MSLADVLCVLSWGKLKRKPALSVALSGGTGLSNSLLALKQCGDAPQPYAAADLEQRECGSAFGGTPNFFTRRASAASEISDDVMMDSNSSCTESDIEEDILGQDTGFDEEHWGMP